ncbi:hypothetical protein U1Q18_023808, partial [Sarracenia purpurea var. burkii]
MFPSDIDRTSITGIEGDCSSFVSSEGGQTVISNGIPAAEVIRFEFRPSTSRAKPSLDQSSGKKKSPNKPNIDEVSLDNPDLGPVSEYSKHEISVPVPSRILGPLQPNLPPASSQISQWDFFWNPFSSLGYPSISRIDKRVLDDERIGLRQVREEEGIPELANLQ